MAAWFYVSEAMAPAVIALRFTNELQPRVPLATLVLPLNNIAVVLL